MFVGTSQNGFAVDIDNPCPKSIDNHDADVVVGAKGVHSSTFERIIIDMDDLACAVCDEADVRPSEFTKMSSNATLSDDSERKGRGVMLNKFIEPPTKYTLVGGAAFFYAGHALNLLVAVAAGSDGRWRVCITNVVSVFLPGILHAANVYFVLNIVKRDMPKQEKRRMAILCALGLNRFIEAKNYFNGIQPIWSLAFKERLGYLTVAVIPSVTFNIVDLLEGTGTDRFVKRILMAVTMFSLLKAAWTVKLVHTCSGPPGNMQKYRFWDLRENPWFHVGIMLLVDFSQVYYRVVMIALVAAFAGVGPALVVVSVMATVTALFAKLGFEYIQSYEGAVVLMSSITGLENVAYDYPWLEPVPVYSFYIESSYVLRLLQALGAGYLIAGHWERHKNWDDVYFAFFFYSCAACACIYFLVYPYYVFWHSRERVAVAKMKRDVFLSGQTKGKSERREQKLSKNGSAMDL